MWKNHNFHNSYLDVTDIMTAWTVIRHVYLQQLMALALGTTYVTHICSILIGNIFLFQLMITNAIVSERYFVLRTKENVGIFLHHLRFSIAITFF